MMRLTHAKCSVWPHSRQGVAAIVVHRSDASRDTIAGPRPILRGAERRAAHRFRGTRGDVSRVEGHPLTNNNRFDAALRAHAFHRPFVDGEAGAATPGIPAAEQSTGEPRSEDFAAELEAALMRDLNSLAAGLR